MNSKEAEILSVIIISVVLISIFIIPYIFYRSQRDYKKDYRIVEII
jgi:hypothetical protein